MELIFNVKGQEISRTDDDTYLVRDSKNYVNITINFLSEEWENLQKYVIFKTKTKNYNIPLGLGDTFTFTPPDIIMSGDFFRVGVYGSYYDYLEETETLIPTDECIIILKQSTYTTDISPIDDVPEDIFNKVMSELENKVDKIDGKGLSTEDFTTEEKEALATLTLDDELSLTSTHPVQNRVITNAINNKADIIHEHITRDITNFEDSVDIDLDNLLFTLTEKIRQL